MAQQQVNVSKKQLRAPFAGRAGIITVNPGAYLNSGTTIVTLQQLDPVYVDFHLPQRNLGDLQGRPEGHADARCVHGQVVRRHAERDQPEGRQRHAQRADRSERAEPRSRADAGHVRQRQRRGRRQAALSDAAADRDRLQPVRRDGLPRQDQGRVRQDAGRECGREQGRATSRATRRPTTRRPPTRTRRRPIRRPCRPTSSSRSRHS